MKIGDKEINCCYYCPAFSYPPAEQCSCGFTVDIVGSDPRTKIHQDCPLADLLKDIKALKKINRDLAEEKSKLLDIVNDPRGQDW